MRQTLDSVGPNVTKRFMHHYNFPSFSTGEARRVGSPGRREIGHGALAERAVLPALPSEDEFPYAIRAVLGGGELQRQHLDGQRLRHVPSP